MSSPSLKRSASVEEDDNTSKVVKMDPALDASLASRKFLRDLAALTGKELKDNDFPAEYISFIKSMVEAFETNTEKYFAGFPSEMKAAIISASTMEILSVVTAKLTGKGMFDDIEISVVKEALQKAEVKKE